MINFKKKIKKPYQIRIEEDKIEALKELASVNETSVNHEIRQAIKQYLNK